jgi:hypothetical protein
MAAAVLAVAIIKSVTDAYSEQWVDDVFIGDATPASSFSAGHEKNTMMRHAYPASFELVQPDNMLLQKGGML